MKRKRTILIILASTFVVAGFYGGHEYFRGKTDIATLKEAFIASDAQILGEFSSNETAATHKYLGKVVLISGVLKDIEKDEKGYYTVVIGEPGSSSSIRCTMDHEHALHLDQLKKGITTSVKGELTGYNADETGLLGSDVVLNGSMVVSNLN